MSIGEKDRSKAEFKTQAFAIFMIKWKGFMIIIYYIKKLILISELKTVNYSSKI